MKKRMVPIVMAVIMALSLTACGKDKTVSSTEVSESTVSSVEEKAVPATEEAVKTADVETEADTSVEASETEEEDVIILGKVDDDAYTNDFFGIKIAQTDGYTFADERMLDVLNNYALDRLSNSDSEILKLASKQVKEGVNVIDTYVYDSMGLNTLNVTVAYR